MKLREQASLWCKILALLCVVLSLNSLQQSVPQAIGMMGLRGGGAGWQMLLYMVAPATILCLFAAALWSVSPFVATLMIPEAIVEKISETEAIPVATFKAQDAMRIALVVMGLWLFVQGSVGVGNILAMRAATAALSASSTAANASIAMAYQTQMNWQTAGGALHLIFGFLFLLLSRPISRRAFPN